MTIPSDRPAEREVPQMSVEELRSLQALGGEIAEEHLVLNMGPQHPSTHGVLRLLLELDGERVVKCVPDVGYLHTGIEKEMETKTYLKSLVLTDRMDYLAPLTNNLAYCTALEKLMDVTVPPRAQAIRLILNELQRLNSHLVWLGTHALDLAAISMFWYTMRERELILDVFEMVSGARMMTSYFRPGGVWRDVPAGFEDTVRAIVNKLPGRIDEYARLLTRNPIFMDRTQGIGAISGEDALAWGLTGPSLRASGVNWDLRKAEPYCGYEQYEFDVPLGEHGDVYDRYLCRLAEMYESVKIIRQALDRGLPPGEVMTGDRKIAPPPRSEIGVSMEALIHHFKLWTEGFTPPAGEVYRSIESPRGEIGCYIRSDGTPRPARVRFRTPSFVGLGAMPVLSKTALVADLVAIVGSIDIVLGDCDR